MLDIVNRLIKPVESGFKCFYYPSKNDLMPDRLTVCAMCVQCMCIQYGFVHIK